MPETAPTLDSHAANSTQLDRNGPPPSAALAPPPADLPALCANLHARVQAFLAQDFAAEYLRSAQVQTRISLGVIREALDRYSLPQLSLSYNGGKDCLVLLILYLTALAALPPYPSRPPSPSSSKPKSHTTPPPATAPKTTIQTLPASLQSIYIPTPLPFPQIESFVRSSSETYRLRLTRLAGKSMAEAFGEYLDRETEVRAIFVGTRSTDPHGGKLTGFDRTDGGWPAFVRISPVLGWRFRDVWAFITYLEIPYCEMYDMGYTSLGDTTDTHPNPKLRVEEADGRVWYRPACQLAEDEEERAGRE